MRSLPKSMLAYSWIPVCLLIIIMLTGSAVAMPRRAAVFESTLNIKPERTLPLEDGTFVVVGNGCMGRDCSAQFVRISNTGSIVSTATGSDSWMVDPVKFEVTFGPTDIISVVSFTQTTRVYIYHLTDTKVYLPIVISK